MKVFQTLFYGTNCMLFGVPLKGIHYLYNVHTTGLTLVFCHLQKIYSLLTYRNRLIFACIVSKSIYVSLLFPIPTTVFRCNKFNGIPLPYRSFILFYIFLRVVRLFL